MTNQTYDVSGVADLLKVPPEKWDACIRDILYTLHALRLAHGDGIPPLGELIWTDDGAHDVTLMDASGETYLHLEMEQQK